MAEKTDSERKETVAQLKAYVKLHKELKKELEELELKIELSRYSLDLIY